MFVCFPCCNSRGSILFDKQKGTPVSRNPERSRFIDDVLDLITRLWKAGRDVQRQMLAWRTLRYSMSWRSIVHFNLLPGSSRVWCFLLFNCGHNFAQKNIISTRTMLRPSRRDNIGSMVPDLKLLARILIRSLYMKHTKVRAYLRQNVRAHHRARETASVSLISSTGWIDFYNGKFYFKKPNSYKTAKKWVG